MSDTVLKLDNNHSYLLTENDKLKNILWGALRFRERNYFHNPRYKAKMWDGYCNFFNRDTGKFLTGLLPEIKLALRQMQIEYSVIDNRDVVKFTQDKVDEQWLNQHIQPNMKPVELRDYQVDYINQSIKNQRGTIFAPTSAGKAQPLDSIVYTPSGPRRMGQIEPGNKVSAPDGTFATVLATFPQGDKEICRITFSNGDTVECCEDHLWKVDTGEIRSTKHLSNQFRIKKTEPLYFYGGNNEIDPYFMGKLLLKSPNAIPDNYKYASISARTQLMATLLDSKDVFSTSLKQLAIDFKEVAESLGYICYWGNNEHTIIVSRHTDWIIDKIEKIGKKECKCLLIDSEEHLYVTDHCIPTHNTNVLIGILLALPKNTPSLILANRKSLVDQNYDEIKKWGIQDVGRFYGDYKEVRNITCATVQSAHLLKSQFPKIKCLFVDEIHEMMSKKPRAVYAACKNASVRIGMSATPFKFGETDRVQKYEVKGFIGPIFLASNTETGRLTTKDLQTRGYLSSAECVFYTVNEPKLPYHVYMDAVTDGIANNMTLHKMTCQLVRTLKGRTLIIVERLSHGDLLYDMIPGALWVRGQDDIDTRKGIIKRLKEDAGDLVAIATSGIFNTGISVYVHNLLNCAGGQADHQIIQRFGRGLRTADDKQGLKYYDWYFTNNDYLQKHSEKRMKILEKEGHTLSLKEFDL